MIVVSLERGLPKRLVEYLLDQRELHTLFANIVVKTETLRQANEALKILPLSTTWPETARKTVVNVHITMLLGVYRCNVSTLRVLRPPVV